VLRQALAAGHEVTVFVRTPSKLPPEARGRVSVRTGDLSAHVPLDLIRGQDGLINCAGHIADGDAFVGLFDRLVTGVDSLPAAEQPVCWFLAGAALLDIDSSGRRGVDLPKVRSTYWPHRVNFERLSRSRMDWRLLCPGPMVDESPLGLDRLRISLDALPVKVPVFARSVPSPLLVPVLASLIPQMIVPYADAAALMLANLDGGNPMSCHRVGLALPAGIAGAEVAAVGEKSIHTRRESKPHRAEIVRTRAQRGILRQPQPSFARRICGDGHWCSPWRGVWPRGNDHGVTFNPPCPARKVTRGGYSVPGGTTLTSRTAPVKSARKSLAYGSFGYQSSTTSNRQPYGRRPGY
jgi:hypothetical protein